MTDNGYSHIALGCKPTDEELIAALCQFYGLQAPQVRLSAFGEDWWERPLEGIAIICEVRRTGGDFPTMLEVMLFDKSLRHPQTLMDVAEFCKLFGYRCLTDDRKSRNPYAWSIVETDGRVSRVWVDRDRLDGENSSFVIDGYRPVDEQE